MAEKCRSGLATEDPPSYSEKHEPPLELSHSDRVRARPDPHSLSLVLLLAFSLCFMDVLKRSVPWDTFAGLRVDPYLYSHRHLAGLPEREEALVHTITAQSILEASRNYTAYVHVAGSPEDKHSALVLKEQWSELLGLSIGRATSHIFEAGSHRSRKYMTSQRGGDRIWMDTYFTFINYPANTSFVRMYDRDGRSLFNATLFEQALDEDATSKEEVAGKSIYAPPFHGFSKPGGAEGQLVYVNYGRYEDFAELENRGISLKGKIALARYEANFRGLKVALAAKAGASAILLYNDPFQDGEVTPAYGYAAYPHGPARNPTAIERGSVQKLSLYPGDPLTPNRPAYKNANRLSRDEATSLADIPSLPISYGDATVLLKALEGRGTRIGGEWEGALHDIQYWTGPSAHTVKLFNGIKESIEPIWNVYALIEGHNTDEVVVLGNHRDAWTFGAVDPSSGTAVVREVVKALGALKKTGWKPFRSILIASWDAEEYGLIGSTEYGEDYADWIQKHVVAYLNTDSAIKGSQPSMKASPLLAHAVANALVDAGPLPTNHTRNASVEAVGDLGSGSDFTVFLQHLGIASTNTEIVRRRDEPAYHYHSVYDSQYWQEDFGDPGFVYHEYLAKWLGLLTLRMIDTPSVPFNLTHYAQALSRYSHKVHAALNESLLRHEMDALDLSRLDESISQIRKEVDQLATASSELIGCPHKRAKAMRLANDAARAFEQGFLSGKGLPLRPWYRHLGIAPGRWLGYGATPLPGLYEAIVIDRDVESAKHEAERLVNRFQCMAHSLRRSTRAILDLQ